MRKESLHLDEFKEFKNLCDAQEWGHLYYPFEYMGVFSSEKLAYSLNHYCGALFDPINKWLRGKASEKSYTLNIISTIYSGALLHPLPEDIIVYRIIPASVFQQMIEKYRLFLPHIIFDAGFMSTTLCLDTLKQSSYYLKLKQSERNFTLKLYVPKGTLGLYLAEYVNRISEQEFLLMPNCRFQILKKRKNFCEAILCEQTRPSWAGV